MEPTHVCITSSKLLKIVEGEKYILTETIDSGWLLHDTTGRLITLFFIKEALAFFQPIDFKSEEQMSLLKCECGVSSVGGNRHSDYCPLYVKL